MLGKMALISHGIVMIATVLQEHWKKAKCMFIRISNIAQSGQNGGKRNVGAEFLLCFVSATVIRARLTNGADRKEYLGVFTCSFDSATVIRARLTNGADQNIFASRERLLMTRCIVRTVFNSPHACNDDCFWLCHEHILSTRSLVLTVHNGSHTSAQSAPCAARC